MLVPGTALGRWSIVAIMAFGLFVAIFVLGVATGQRGGAGFFDNLWLALPGLGAFFAAVSAFVLGLVAVAVSGERSVSVAVATIIGLLVTAFGMLEVLLPH